MTENKVDFEGRRYRKTCNTCARAKKKCDGGIPCKYCGKWNIQCVYSERQRPGPSLRSLKSTLSVGNVHLNLFAKASPIIMMDIAFIRYFIFEMNMSVRIVSPDCLKIGLHALFNQSNGFEELSPDSWACMSLTWTACGLGAALSQSDKIFEYFAKARTSVQKCIDSPSFYVAKALVGLEILAQTMTEESKSVFTSGLRSCPVSLFLRSRYDSKGLGNNNNRTRKNLGIYFSLMEAVMSHISEPVIDDDLKFTMDLMRVIGLPSAASTEELTASLLKITSLHEDLSTKMPIHLRIPTYCLNSVLGWQLFFRDMCSKESGVFTSSIAPESVDHMNAYKQDLSNVIPDYQDPISYFLLLVSLGMHGIRMRNIELTLKNMSHAAKFLISRPSVLSSPIIWRLALTVASTLYYFNPTLDYTKAATIVDHTQDGSSRLDLNINDLIELCRVLIVSACYLRQYSPQFGDLEMSFDDDKISLSNMGDISPLSPKDTLIGEESNVKKRRYGNPSSTEMNIDESIEKVASSSDSNLTSLCENFDKRIRSDDSIVKVSNNNPSNQSGTVQDGIDNLSTLASTAITSGNPSKEGLSLMNQRTDKLSRKSASFNGYSGSVSSKMVMSSNKKANLSRQLFLKSFNDMSYIRYEDGDDDIDDDDDDDDDDDPDDIDIPGSRMASTLSMDTGLTSVDSPTMADRASPFQQVVESSDSSKKEPGTNTIHAVGNIEPSQSQSVNTNTVKLSDLSIHVMACLLDLHLRHLIDDVTRSSGEDIDHHSDNMTESFFPRRNCIEPDMKKTALKPLVSKSIILDINIISMAASQHLKRSDLEMSTLGFNSIDGVLSYIFTHPLVHIGNIPMHPITVPVVDQSTFYPMPVDIFSTTRPLTIPVPSIANVIPFQQSSERYVLGKSIQSNHPLQLIHPSMMMEPQNYMMNMKIPALSVDDVVNEYSYSSMTSRPAALPDYLSNEFLRYHSDVPNLFSSSMYGQRPPPHPSVLLRNAFQSSNMMNPIYDIMDNQSFLAPNLLQPNSVGERQAKKQSTSSTFRSSQS